MIPPDTPPFYPARPKQGGMNFLPLCNTFYSNGTWTFEPKYNGWRALLHAPSGNMWNRYGERLSIAGEFKQAIEIIRSVREACLQAMPGGDEELLHHGLLHLVQGEADWYDVEALERRHNRGRGSLVVLDMPLLGIPHEKRSYALRTMFPPSVDHCEEENMVYSVPSYTDGPLLWQEMQDANTRLGITFYEGVVAKRRESIYPLQLRSPKEETPDWIKHRFTTK